MALCTSGDMIAPNSGLDSSGLLNLMPAWESLQILPWNRSTARVFGYLCDNEGNPSNLCTRNYLETQLEMVTATIEKKLEKRARITLGVEIEFTLTNKDKNPVDCYNWAVSYGMDEQDEFIDDLYNNLEAQNVAVELI